ncbi:unnamed protein product [Hapterophycus canaliculatus]
MALFQEVNGLDVMIFGLIVYEYGEECHEAYKGRVYVSYLDSVQYLRPERWRLTAYHGMVIGYLAHARKLRFHTAHLWACPPQEGDDYIFHCHPQDQRTPDQDQLLRWCETVRSCT